jgi:hypothetical protein
MPSTGDISDTRVKCPHHGLWYESTAAGCVLCRRVAPRDGSKRAIFVIGAAIVIATCAVLWRAVNDPEHTARPLGAASSAPRLDVASTPLTQPLAPGDGSRALPPSTQPTPAAPLQSPSGATTPEPVVPRAVVDAATATPAALPPMYPAGAPRRRHQCNIAIQQCMYTTRKIDECVYAAPRCSSPTTHSSDAGDEACCPGSCIDDYRSARGRGVDPSNAMDDLVRSACFGP